MNGTKMFASRAALSVFIWNIYLCLFGLGFLFQPNTVITLLGFPETHEVWIRFFGLLSVVVGTYYARAAMENNLLFFKSSVQGRLLFVTGEVAFVVFHLVSPIVLVFAAIEFASAIWTHVALGAETAKRTHA